MRFFKEGDFKIYDIKFPVNHIKYWNRQNKYWNALNQTKSFQHLNKSLKCDETILNK